MRQMAVAATLSEGRIHVENPWLAFLFNFIFAGAGFVYLGKLGWALADFVGTIAVGVFIAYFHHDWIRLASIALPIINGVIAYSTANKMNAEAR